MENTKITNEFSWIPFYIEFADKLLEYKNNRNELLEIVYGLGDIVNYISLSNGEKYPDIDPFTIYGIFNRGLTIENRKKICKYFKEKFSLSANIPDSFDGIPIINAQKGSFVFRDYINTDVQPIWDLFECSLKLDKLKFNELFDKVLKQKGIRWNLTIALFWIRPYDYINLDSLNREYLPKIGVQKLEENDFNASRYSDIIQKVKSKIESGDIIEKDFPSISFNAFLSAQNYWLVGYCFGSDNSQLDRFVEKKVWEAYFDLANKKQIELVRSMKVGDVLILKSTSTKGSKHDLPFVRVKSIGVIENLIFDEVNDNQQFFKFSVSYYTTEEKDFDGSSYGRFRQTVHKCDDADILVYANSIINKNVIMTSLKTQSYIEFLTDNRNIILHGAPGTGKTYLAKEIAKAMGCSENEIGFVQFHQSYDYTDFVEGLRPVKSDNGQIGFELKDGVFKKFCDKAINNSKSNSVDNFYESLDKLVKKISEEENGIEIPMISGRKNFRIILNSNSDGFIMLIDKQDGSGFEKDSSRFFNFKQCYRVYKGLTGYEDGGSGYDNYRKAIVSEMKKSFGLKDYNVGNISNIPKPFVFIIDEINRGEISKIFGELFYSIDPGYRGDKGKVATQYQNLIEEGDTFKQGFYIPENVYIIGTMNDIDRSVESMDFAMRRRFSFIEISAEESAENMNLNDQIDTIEELNSSYHIGGSYFLNISDFDKLWRTKLQGLLKEYLRGMPNEKEELEKLKKAFFKTQNPVTDDTDDGQ